MAATRQAVRRWIMTGAVTGVTVAGTIAGAQLRGDQQAHQARQRVLEAPPEEMIAQLESTRTDLVRKRNEIEKQMATFAERKKKRDLGEEPQEQQGVLGQRGSK